MSSIDRPLSGDALLLHIGEERERVEHAELLAQHGRNARTLVKEGALRITLIALAAGGAIPTHRADGPISVQVLDGHMQFDVAGARHQLDAGDLLVVNAKVEHAVHSERGATFLLTVVAG
ncbi:MAG TPA: cupin domain-containing protein [Gemmatimonadaceae bacterium]|nr:cupin domain-containing protein [Gemmatimonadaceae bacterium]